MALESARDVPTFLIGLQAQLRLLQQPPTSVEANTAPKSAADGGVPPDIIAEKGEIPEIPAEVEAEIEWSEMESCRPPRVSPSLWSGLCEFIIFKGCLILGPQQLLPFLEELCAPERFACLVQST